MDFFTSFWRKSASTSDVSRANKLVAQKQELEKKFRAFWNKSRKTILSPYLENNSDLVRLILNITYNIKTWNNSLGWTYKDGEFKGIGKGSKVVCTKSNIGHVGYVEDVEGTEIKFHIITLDSSWIESYKEAESSWGLVVLPDSADISKQMTATEAVKCLQRFLPVEKKVEIVAKPLDEAKSIDEAKPIEEKVDVSTILPEITDLSWGCIKVLHLGESLVFKDAKIYPGTAKAWDWGIMLTHHMPGIQYADIQEILDAGVEIIILTRGRHLKLMVSDALKEQIEQEDVTVHIAETEEAVAMYEQFRKEGRNVGIIVHSTC